MAQQPPRGNFIQTLLIVTIIFFGFQLLFPPNRGTESEYYGKKVVTVVEHRDALIDANKNLYDISAQRIYPTYLKLLDTEAQEKKLPAADLEAKKIEAVVLLADTQLKAGIARNDTGRIRNAYNNLVSFENRLLDSPTWSTTVSISDVSGDPRFGWSSWSGHELYKKVVSEISSRAKKDLIWGAIPGGYAFIDFLVQLAGGEKNGGVSYAFAAFILALIVRAIVFPLAQKQLMFGRQMMQLSPLVNEIKDKFKDPNEQQRKVMELYRDYGVNPMAGCFPMFVQLPLFLTVYQCMLLYQFEFQKGTFLWVNPNVAKQFPAGVVAPNMGQLDPALIVIYGVMMIVSTLLQPVNDPSTAKQQRLMGIGIAIFFTVTMFFGLFPVPGAFVLYWIFLLILSTLQSLWAYRLPLAPLQKVNTAAGGTYPTGFGGKWAARMQKMMEEAQAAQASQNGTSSGTTRIEASQIKTGMPAKHKPKKRK
jgi:YidC/Oxa1 family membrane protein insertase